MWTLWFPELRHYPNAHERRALIRRWEARRKPPSRRLLLFLAVFVATPTMTIPLFMLDKRLHAFGLFIWFAIVYSIGFAVRVLFFQIGGRRFRAFIRNDLLSQRICWRCGYDLTGNETGRCSECGQTGVNIVAEY
ncbi:MAG TPA: hypothetical protein PK093_05730 [Phycisphaerae bacterium]|nr:hypothetical protein [Phycisphaerae bacterium]